MTWGGLAWGLDDLVNVSQSPCFRAQRAMVKRIFFKNLKKYKQIQKNVETHKKQSNERLTWVTSLLVTLLVGIGEVKVARPDFFPRLLFS